MFRYIDLNNIQQYFDDAGMDGNAVVSVEGSLVNVTGTLFNFIKKATGTFFLNLDQNDRYRLSFSSGEKFILQYDEDRKCSVDRI